MLIRLRPEQLQSAQPRAGQEDFGYGDYVAYSKICTHAGCPVSLYEQETSRILCPCHQSQFDVTQGAKPVRSEEHTSELQSRQYLVCRLLLEKNKLHSTSPPLTI